MIQYTGKNFLIQPLIDQVNELGEFGRSLAINYTEGELLNGPYKTKPEFENTPLGDILESLGNPGEARLLKLAPSETYSAHADPDDRWHVAIITNEYCYLIDFDDHKMYHLPANGELWYMDTSKMHVAANFGPRERIHLNIRKALPAFNAPGIKLSINGGEYDWKQKSYVEIMTFFNREIKAGKITGFQKINEREVLLNCNEEILTPFIERLTDLGFNIELTRV